MIDKKHKTDIILVAGARPNFVKIAPIIRELQKQNVHSWKLVHTGQHYDYAMSQSFFDELGIPKPDYNLNIGSGSHARQTAGILVGFEDICIAEKPQMVVVVGDVNSTLACAITAKKLQIKVVHVESGLRSGDMTMPEEINRIVTDSISDYFFVTEKSAVDNLVREGKSEECIFFVGNVMIDNLFYSLQKIVDERAVDEAYIVITMHRPSNVDNKEILEQLLLAFRKIATNIKIFFPIHPRTQKKIDEFGLQNLLKHPNIVVSSSMPYLAFLKLWSKARLVITDSGGLQEETTALKIPCFTVRENTERPITLLEGSNVLVGCLGDNILSNYEKLDLTKKYKIPELWDGKAAERIVAIIQQKL